jgi:hypothetical protein
LTQHIHRLARAVVPPAWIGVFAFLAMKGSSPIPTPLPWLLWLAAAGFLYCSIYCRTELSGLFSGHRLLMGGLLGLALAIAISETIARVIDVPLLPPFFPAQIGLVLCAAPLAVLLMEPRWMRALALVFLAVCGWHFVALPVEAVSGAKLTWHTVAPQIPRPAGPLKFQAAGLALQAYYFAGLFAPMLYLAAGPLFEHRPWSGHEPRRRLIAALSLAWLIPCACVQSRSLFAGALAASLFYLVASRGGGHVRRWLLAAGLAAIALAGYWYLFSANKSGFNLRWLYLRLYWHKAWEWPWVVFGRGLSFEPNLAMLIPGVDPITHSHNDIVQMLYTWGIATLLCYAVFWVGLLKLIGRSFVGRKQYWPVCALLVAVPSMITDLGFEHYEKAAFLVILAAFCMALTRVAPTPDAQPATP